MVPEILFYEVVSVCLIVIEEIKTTVAEGGALSGMGFNKCSSLMVISS